jgi:LPS export ABC transporter permease LptG
VAAKCASGRFLYTIFVKERVMKILDKYLLKHFFPAYLLSGITFCFFYCLVDLLSNLSKFIDKGAEIIDIAKFYVFLLPPLWMKLSPLAVLIGVWFSVGHLAQDREIMAMRLSGISAARIILPLLILGLIISFFCLGINTSLVPLCEEKRQDIWKGKIQGEEEYLKRNRKDFIFSSEGVVYFVKSFNEKEGSMNTVQVIYNESMNNTETTITAQEALWHEGKWILIDGLKRTFDEAGDVKKIEEFDVKEISLSLTPHELWLYNKSPSFLSMGTIKKYILEHKKSSGSLYPYWTEFHSRFSLPFINFTLLVVSIPFCLLSLHQSAVGRMGWALGLSLIYYVFFSLMAAVAEKGGISPPLGIWLPNILFLSIGIFFIWKKR